MATTAPVTGGVTTILGIGGATQLSAETKACRQLSIRSHIGNTEVHVGDASVAIGHRWGFMLEGETFTIGPFQPGVGIRPCDIYIRSASINDAVTWMGFHA